jgi:hypothetical protein
VSCQSQPWEWCLWDKEAPDQTDCHEGHAMPHYSKRKSILITERHGEIIEFPLLDVITRVINENVVKVEFRSLSKSRSCSLLARLREAKPSTKVAKLD